MVNCSSYIVEKRKPMRLWFHPAMVSRRSDQRKTRLIICWKKKIGCFNCRSHCLSGCMVCIFHEVSIHINVHFWFFYSIIPHFFYKLPICLTMCGFNNLFILLVLLFWLFRLFSVIWNLLNFNICNSLR